MIHLDTSFLIRSLIENTPEMHRLRSWLDTREPIGMSTISWTEFLCGPLTEQHIRLAGEILGDPVRFTEDGARMAARLFNETGRRRGSLLDCMVAAAALVADASLATSNLEDFRRFVPHGLLLAG